MQNAKIAAAAQIMSTVLRTYTDLSIAVTAFLHTGKQYFVALLPTFYFLHAFALGKLIHKLVKASNIPH